VFGHFGQLHVALRDFIILFLRFKHFILFFEQIWSHFFKKEFLKNYVAFDNHSHVLFIATTMCHLIFKNSCLYLCYTYIILQTCVPKHCLEFEPIISLKKCQHLDHKVAQVLVIVIRQTFSNMFNEKLVGNPHFDMHFFNQNFIQMEQIKAWSWSLLKIPFIKIIIN